MRGVLSIALVRTIVVILLATSHFQVARPVSPAPISVVASVHMQSVSSVRATNLTQQIIHVPADMGLQQAINQVSNEGIIEITNGTYSAPSGGWRINNLNKNFTIRAATGDTVILDGSGTTDILRFQNSSVSQSGIVTFEGLTFANGHSTTEGIAGGITLYDAQATFVRCVFQNNSGDVLTTAGGAVYVAEYSVVFFFDSNWVNNSSKVGGGGLGIRSYSRVIVHNSRFTHNVTNPPNHNMYSGGGGINVGNSILRVSNTRFENNQAGAYGGALYAIGNWVDPITVPQADILIANSTFIDNQAVRDPSVQQSFPTEGGAINTEDQSIMRIYNSRFVNNKANIGGGVNIFRGSVEIRSSVFLGNQANGTNPTGSFGGGISINSSDGPADGDNNRPTGHLIVEDTLLQGRYGTVTTGAHAGGCLHANGDGTRMDGDPSVPDMGTAADNRAQVVLRRDVLFDCDAAAIGAYSGVGGALELAIADLTAEDTLILSSDALGNGASGGGAAIVYYSLANINRTTVARNTSGLYGGGIFAQGSTINVRDSNLIENEVSPGMSEAESQSYGAAIFSAPDTVRNISVTGAIENNLISNNVGMSVFDDDRFQGPINDIRYNGNQFFASTFAPKVYRDALTASQTLVGLNGLVVSRSGSVPSTDKSQVNNSALGSAPVVGSILAVPSSILPANAYGDPAPPVVSYLGYAWSGGSAFLMGNPVSGNTGATAVSSAGVYTLSVAGNSFTTTVFAGVVPTASFASSTSDTLITLSWSLLTGTFLDAAIDQGVSITPAPSGSVQVSAPTGKVYRFYAITQQGGVVKAATVGLPILQAPPTVTVLAGLDTPVNRGYVPVHNAGEGTLVWTDQTTTPGLIQLETTGGQTQSDGVISFLVNISGLAPGIYTGYINIDAGAAGSQQVTITVRVVAKLFRVFLPSLMR